MTTLAKTIRCPKCGAARLNLYRTFNEPLTMITIDKDAKTPTWVITKTDSEGYHRQLTLTEGEVRELAAILPDAEPGIKSSMTAEEILEKIRKQVKAWMPERDGDEHTEGERLAFRSVLHLLDEMEEMNHLIDANKMVGEDMEKAARDASIQYQKSLYPMAIGGDCFAEEVNELNVNLSFIAGAKFGAKWQGAKAIVWHKATETPTPDTEVLAEVKGFEHNRFAVLQWNKEGWWQHIPRMNDIMPSDGWVGTQGLFVIRWAYIIADGSVR